MAFLDDNAKELLSGYLDGELTTSEALVVQRLLEESGEAREELRRLQAIRRAFQSEPKLHLSGDFAARVLEASERRAISMGRQQPVWLGGMVDRLAPVVSAASRMEERHREEGTKRRQWAWGVLSTVAASGLLVCLSYWDAREVRSGRLQGVAGLAGSAVSSPLGDESKNGNPMASNTMSPSVVEVDGKDGLAQTGERTSEPLSGQLAGANPSGGVSTGEGALLSVDGVEDRRTSSAMDSAVTNSVVAKSEVPDTAMEGSGVAKATASGGDFASLMGASQEEQLNQLAALANGTGSLMMVVDFSVSKEVWESDFVPTLLGRYDVAFDGPAVVDEAILEQLKASRMVGPLDGQSDPSMNVALVFVKARASRIEKMIEEIAVNPRDFPEFSFDLSIDLALQHGLSTIREFQESPQAADTARVLDRRSNRVEGSLARFAPSDRPRNLVGLEQRQRWESPPMLDDKMNPVSYTLLIIRPASEKR